MVQLHLVGRGGGPSIGSRRRVVLSPLALAFAGSLLVLGACDEPSDPPGDAGQDDSGLDPSCLADAGPPTDPPEPSLSPALRGYTSLGLAGAADITNRTGENPTVSTWDGRIIIRKCPDPAWPSDDYVEDPVGGQPGVIRGAYWCFHAFRPARVTLDVSGTPDFSDAFGPGYTSTTRHVSHSGGFPVVENLSPAARWNPYPSTADGVACGLASLDAAGPACPAERYATYDLYIVHTVLGNNPTVELDYPVLPIGPGTPTFFEQMLVVVQDPETDSARVVDVVRESTPFPMQADPAGFGYLYGAQGDTGPRNPYLWRAESDPTGPTYVGGPVTIEPGATNDGRMVIWNGGDESRSVINLIYSWNPTPASPTGWSPPKNVAYMYYVEGPGAPGGETMIEIDGVEVPFSDVFPIARQPLRDQDGLPYEPGSTYVPATYDATATGYPLFRFDSTISEQQYDGAYPWISWDGRNIMSLNVGRFNVAVIGDLTNYGLYWIDGGIDRTDFHGDEGVEITAMWNLGQWPGRWAQFANEYEGRTRTIPTRLRDAPTWAIFEQDHYSEISFHKTDGSYAIYFPMSRMRDRVGIYRAGATPDVSGRFNNGRFVGGYGEVDFSQLWTEDGFEDATPRSAIFGYSGQSVAFLSRSDDAAVAPHVAADALDGIGGAVTVEGAVFLRTSATLPATPWSTVARQPGAFALGVDDAQVPYFEVTDADGASVRVEGEGAIAEDTWVHLTGVYDGSQARLYVDARLAGAAPGTERPIASSAAEFVVGPASHDGEPGGNGLVYIDEVGVTPSVRPFEEIAHSAFQRVEWPTASLDEWESLWGEGSMPLGLVDETGALLAPIHLGYAVGGDAEARVRLGEQLFHDGALSTTDPPISCESCHGLTPEHGGARAFEPLSTQGAGALTRHTPTVFNRVFGREQFWDGRAPGLADQLLFPIASEVEMNMPLDRLSETVLPAAGYSEAFCQAFGDADTTIARLAEAITLYESGLVSGNSAVDRRRFLGEPLSESAERGLAIFETKGRCVGCHAPPLYTDERYHDNGQGNETDPGRGAITAHPRDMGRFRTMSLRDVDRTPPYMHDGSVATLEEVVQRYDDGGDDLGELDVRPLHLSAQERSDLVEFLRALRSETTVVPLR